MTEKTLTNVRGFQKFINQTFEVHEDDISLNSIDAIYQLGGGITSRAPHDKFLRFEWKMPFQQGETLLHKVFEHKWAKTGMLYAIKVTDLEEGNLYQLQASREMIAFHPEMDAIESWSVVCKSGYGRPPPHMFPKGVSLRTKMSLFANLDVSGVLCDSGRNPVQSFSWKLFHNDGIVLFYGPEAAFVKFWNSTASNENKESSMPLRPMMHSTWAQPSQQFSFEVRPCLRENCACTNCSRRLWPIQKLATRCGPKFWGACIPR